MYHAARIPDCLEKQAEYPATCRLTLSERAAFFSVWAKLCAACTKEGRETTFMLSTFPDRTGLTNLVLLSVALEVFCHLKKSGIVPAVLGTPGDRTWLLPL